MRIKQDLKRFKEIGESHRMDLEDFIKYGEMNAGNSIKVPIKIINLPEFIYDRYSMGGIGQGEGEVGDPVEVEPGESDEPGEPGEKEGEHGYYDMDPEEFAQELDDKLGLDMEPKGKKVKEITEGAMVEKVRSGPDATIDFEQLYKKGLKRHLALYFDEEYLTEVLKVNGMGIQKTFEWARGQSIPVSKSWIEQAYKSLNESELNTYDSIEDIEKEYRSQPMASDLKNISLRREDKRHKYPEIKKEYEKNAVIIFIRDISGSMTELKRDLVERLFTPLDWYLTGKYDNAEFRYIAHDFNAKEVNRNEFFGIRSGGGTLISSAYEMTEDILDEQYPFSEWNRYVFAAGDGENPQHDTIDNVIPLMEQIDANLHSYTEVKGNTGWGAQHADLVSENIGDQDNVVVTRVDSKDDIMESIEDILSTEGSE